MANLLLIRGGGAGGTLPAWGAALATAAALGCKQTTLGLVAAQVAWLGWEHGRRAWQGHLLRTLGAGLVLGGLAVLQFGARELWFGVVTVPRGLPLAEDIAARFAAQAPFLAIQAGIPLLILAVIGRRLALRGHPLALPALTFLASLPLGLAGISTAGGTTNSFQGLQYILPVLVLLGLARIGATRGPDGPQPGTGSARFDSRMTFACAALCCVLLGKILWSEAAPFRPDIAPVRQAIALQQAQPGALWLPWNPLVSYFGEGRFYHAEDGIYVRFITGHPVSRRQAEAGMPAAVRSMAFPSPGMTWDVATKLAPPGATRRRDGEWLIIGWP